MVNSKDVSRNKTFPSKDKKDGLRNVNLKLKAKIRKLESNKKRLLSEIRQLKAVFENTENFLKNSTEEFSVEEVLKKVKNKKTLHDPKKNKESKDTIICPDCTTKISPIILQKFDIHTCSCGYRKRVFK